MIFLYLCRTILLLKREGFNKSMVITYEYEQKKNHKLDSFTFNK